MSRGSVALLLAAGALLSACVAFWARAGDLSGRIGPHLLAYGVAFVAYLLALHASPRLAGRGLVLALVLAGAWRLALVPAPPLLSDDVHRYVWEGRVQLAGGNPYAWNDRPDAARWAALRDAAWRRVAHKSYTAVYPPLWQLAARAVAWVSPSVAAMKAFLVACELVLWGVLAALLRRRGLPPSRLLALAWSPLAIVEIAGSGHNDPFGMLWLGLGLLALEAGRGGLSAACVALGFEAKLLPAFVALAWVRSYRPRQLALAAGVALLVTAPFVSAGAGLWRTLDAYGAWRFNESALALLDLAGASRVGATRIAALLVAGLALLLAARGVEAARSGLAVVAASLALAAHGLPWYALWLLPWLVLADAPAALLFTWTVGFAYLVYPAWQSGGGWHLGWGIRALEYGPCLAVAAWTWARRRERAAPA